MRDTVTAMVTPSMSPERLQLPALPSVEEWMRLASYALSQEGRGEIATVIDPNKPGPYRFDLPLSEGRYLRLTVVDRNCLVVAMGVADRLVSSCDAAQGAWSIKREERGGTNFRELCVVFDRCEEELDLFVTVRVPARVRVLCVTTSGGKREITEIELNPGHVTRLCDGRKSERGLSLDEIRTYGEDACRRAVGWLKIMLEHRKTLSEKTNLTGPQAVPAQESGVGDGGVAQVGNRVSVLQESFDTCFGALTGLA